MRKDILIILACLCIGSTIMGCGTMVDIAGIIAEPETVLYDIATDAVIDTILPDKEGKFKGVKLGMTAAEVREVIEKSESLTYVDSVEGRDQAKTVMWGFETWVWFLYHEGKLFQITYGTVMVPEDLIETDLRKQLGNFYYYFYREFGEPDYTKENFSLKKITVSSFEEACPILVYVWIEGNVEMGLWLNREIEGDDLEYTNVKYYAAATVWDRRVIKKRSEGKIED